VNTAGIERRDDDRVRIIATTGSNVSVHPRIARRLVDLYGFDGCAEAAHSLVRLNINTIATHGGPARANPALA
jgi:hypothetical protein